MMSKYFSVTIIIFSFVLLTCTSTPKFDVVETSISEIHEAIKSGKITCEELVQIYLDRIEKYDQPTGLNSMVVINPNAIKRAQELDEEFKQTGELRPLHGIPIIVKDNYDTYDLQTAGGSLALKGSLPPDDAFQVRKVRDAGAIVIGKSNMAEWAFSPYVTISSIADTTRNPYDLDRVPAGSSGGTAAAVAANLGTIGLGTDTGNSIRGPSSHCGLVGIRSTMGITSRDGIIPLYLRNDIGGPMCRTVEDAVRLFEVIAGYDPADPITELCKDKTFENYTQFLNKDGLVGKRIGIFRFYTENRPVDSQIKNLFDQAVKDIQTFGAEIVDPFEIPDFEELAKDIWKNMFHHDVNEYLKSLGDNAPYKKLEEIINTGLYSPYIESRLKRNVKADPNLVYRDLYSEQKNIDFRQVIIKAMDNHNLDAIIYPTWSFPPRKYGDMETPAGDNSQMIPPHTGMPGFTVPMGFSYGNLPAGLQIVGKLFDELTLIEIAYAYEQATKHRKPPQQFSSN